MATVALVSSGWASFIEADAAILAREHDVRKVLWNGRRSFRNLRDTLRASRLALVWFAGDHAAVTAFLARRQGKACVLVTGGADIASDPSIGYGAMAGSFRDRLATRLSLRWADLILPFSDSSAAEVRRIMTPRRMEVVPLGVDTERFSPGHAKEDIVVTVGAVNASNLTRKGHGTFVAAASQVPEARFVLAGTLQDATSSNLRRAAPGNVEFAGHLSDDALLDLYRRAKVYVQASAHEGFGLAVAEAMACGCVPVVTRRGSLPEVVGEAGVYVEYGDPMSTGKAVREALSLPESAGSRARERVVARFSIARRADRLLPLVAANLKAPR